MCPNPEETADLVTFTEEILNGKLYFLCSVIHGQIKKKATLTLMFCHTSLFMKKFVISTFYK